MSFWSKHWLMLMHQSSPVILPLHCLISSDKLILRCYSWQTNVIPKKILSDYSSDKWRPPGAGESNQFTG